jgi:multidrug transporter EmrE-like cation transporter
MALLAVMVTVLMSISTALLLDYAAGRQPAPLSLLAIVIAPVIGINIAKFGLWGWIHRRYPLSQTYPASTIFFPLIYGIALWTGEAHLESAKIVGVALIVCGIWFLQFGREEKLL